MAYFMPCHYAESLLQSEKFNLGIKGSFFKLHSLTAALNAMSGRQKKNEELMETAKKQEEKLAVLEKEFSVLQEEGNKLKLEQVQSSGLVAWFQAEKDAIERKYGQWTALIGMLEAQISELKALNEENKLKLKEMIEVVKKKDDDLWALSRDLEHAQVEANSNQHIVELICNKAHYGRACDHKLSSRSKVSCNCSTV
jgi:chromosome segregation ATPase